MAKEKGCRLTLAEAAQVLGTDASTVRALALNDQQHFSLNEIYRFGTAMPLVRRGLNLKYRDRLLRAQIVGTAREVLLVARTSTGTYRVTQKDDAAETSVERIDADTLSSAGAMAMLRAHEILLKRAT